MICVQPHDEYFGEATSLFLAGGITGCEPWQDRMAEMLSQSSLVVLNPRQPDYRDDRKAAVCQIRWEHRHLRRATARLFWFPNQTLCPIALFELGAWSRTDEPLFVGVDPDYQRRLDVEIQLRLARPDVHIVYKLEELAAQVLRWQQSGEEDE